MDSSFSLLSFQHDLTMYRTINLQWISTCEKMENQIKNSNSKGALKIFLLSVIHDSKVAKTLRLHRLHAKLFVSLFSSSVDEEKFYVSLILSGWDFLLKKEVKRSLEQSFRMAYFAKKVLRKFSDWRGPKKNDCAVDGRNEERKGKHCFETLKHSECDLGL